ncbi:MAG: flippase [Patescibacteria group bacterium]|mgnify:CR=1 FL=1
MSVARKILSNTLAQIIGKIFLGLLGFAVVKICTNYLSQESFGQYTVVYEFLAYFGIVADLGLFTVAIKEMSENEDKIPKLIANIFAIRTVLVLLVMAVAIISSFFIPKFEDTLIPFGVAIASITVILTIMNGTITSVLQTKFKMEIASFATVIGKALTVLFMTYVIFWGFPENKETGFYMLMVAGTLGAALMFFTTYYHVRKITPITFRFDKEIWKDVLKKSIPYGIALILNTIYFRIDTMMIFNLRSEEELALYAVPMRMLEQLAILPLYFMNSVLPVLTKAIKEKSEKYKDIIRYSFDFLTALSVPMVVGGFVLAYPIIFLISNPDYLSRISEGFYGSDVAFQVLIFASLFQFLNVLFAFILISIEKQYRMLYINSACVVFKIISSLILIPKYGFIAAAATSVITEFLILIYTYLSARKYLKFTLNYKNIFKIILAAAVMGIVIYFLQPLTYPYMENWNVIFLIVVGIAIYGGMLIATKVLTRDTIRLLKGSDEPPRPDPSNLNTFQN